MQLTKEQIQNLYNFVAYKHVEWYELQTELVDHLANDIETIWKTEPKLSFIRARNKAYLKFGVCGFAGVVEQKERTLYKKYWLQIWHEFKSYFKLPKIILTLFLTAIIYSLFNFVENKNLFVRVVFSITLLIPFVLAVYNIILVRLRQRKTKKKWMFEHIIYSYGGLIYLLIQIPSFIFSEYSINWSFQNQLLFSFLLVLTGILSYLLVKILPEKIEESVAKQYPEYILYKNT